MVINKFSASISSFKSKCHIRNARMAYKLIMSITGFVIHNVSDFDFSISFKIFALALQLLKMCFCLVPTGNKNQPVSCKGKIPIGAVLCNLNLLFQQNVYIITIISNILYYPALIRSFYESNIEYDIAQPLIPHFLIMLSFKKTQLAYKRNKSFWSVLLCNFWRRCKSTSSNTISENTGKHWQQSIVLNN